MGKGDKKTRKGKISIGSSGNVRPKFKKELGVREKSNNLKDKKVEEVKPKATKTAKLKIEDNK